MLIKRLLAGCVIAALSNCALADGPMAAQALFSNLARAGKNLKVSEQDARVTRTLVRGMYTVVDAKGVFVTFVNEDGTLYGDKNGLYIFPAQGAAPRKMSAKELAAFRLEVVNAIDRDALIMNVYGNGGERGRTVIFSSIDCPACHDLEKDLGKPGRNAIFYVAPSTMLTNDGEGAEEWAIVAKLWCAKDNARAWRNYMTTRALPAARPCAFADPMVARRAWINLYSILKNTGLTVSAEPGFVFEDGSFKVGADAADRPTPSTTVKAQWLPQMFPPNPPSGLPLDSFLPQPVKTARRPERSD